MIISGNWKMYKTLEETITFFVGAFSLGEGHFS